MANPYICNDVIGKKTHYISTFFRAPDILCLLFQHRHIGVHAGQHIFDKQGKKKRVARPNICPKYTWILPEFCQILGRIFTIGFFFWGGGDTVPPPPPPSRTPMPLRILAWPDCSKNSMRRRYNTATKYLRNTSNRSVLSIFHSWDCLSHPCQNGGSCVETVDAGYFCSCPAGFFGVNCQTGMHMHLHWYRSLGYGGSTQSPGSQGCWGCYMLFFLKFPPKFPLYG